MARGDTAERGGTSQGSVSQRPDRAPHRTFLAPICSDDLLCIRHARVFFRPESDDCCLSAQLFRLDLRSQLRAGFSPLGEPRENASSRVRFRSSGKSEGP